MAIDIYSLPTRLRISFPPHKQVLERELEPRTIAALQEDVRNAYEELFQCELHAEDKFRLYLSLDSDPSQPRVVLQRERQLSRYITVDESGQFVILRVQAEPFQEGLAGELKADSFGELAPRQPGSVSSSVVASANSNADPSSNRQPECKHDDSSADEEEAPSDASPVQGGVNNSNSGEEAGSPDVIAGAGQPELAPADGSAVQSLSPKALMTSAPSNMSAEQSHAVPHRDLVKAVAAVPAASSTASSSAPGSSDNINSLSFDSTSSQSSSQPSPMSSESSQSTVTPDTPSESQTSPSAANEAELDDLTRTFHLPTSITPQPPVSECSQSNATLRISPSNPSLFPSKSSSPEPTQPVLQTFRLVTTSSTSNSGFSTFTRLNVPEPHAVYSQESRLLSAALFSSSSSSVTRQLKSPLTSALSRSSASIASSMLSENASSSSTPSSSLCLRSSSFSQAASASVSSNSSSAESEVSTPQHPPSISSSSPRSARTPLWSSSESSENHITPHDSDENQVKVDDEISLPASSSSSSVRFASSLSESRSSGLTSPSSVSISPSKECPVAAFEPTPDASATSTATIAATPRALESVVADEDLFDHCVDEITPCPPDSDDETRTETETHELWEQIPPELLHHDMDESHPHLQPEPIASSLAQTSLATGQLNSLSLSSGPTSSIGSDVNHLSAAHDDESHSLASSESDDNDDHNDDVPHSDKQDDDANVDGPSRQSEPTKSKKSRLSSRQRKRRKQFRLKMAQEKLQYLSDHSTAMPSASLLSPALASSSSATAHQSPSRIQPMHVPLPHQFLQNHGPGLMQLPSVHVCPHLSSASMPSAVSQLRQATVAPLVSPPAPGDQFQMLRSHPLSGFMRPQFVGAFASAPAPSGLAPPAQPTSMMASAHQAPSSINQIGRQKSDESSNDGPGRPRQHQIESGLMGLAPNLSNTAPSVSSSTTGASAKAASSSKLASPASISSISQAPAPVAPKPAQSHHSKSSPVLLDRCDQHDHRGRCSRAGCPFAHVCLEFTRHGECGLAAVGACQFVHPCPLGSNCPSFKSPAAASGSTCLLLHVRPIRRCKFGSRQQCQSPPCVMQHAPVSHQPIPASTPAVGLYASSSLWPPQTPSASTRNHPPSSHVQHGPVMPPPFATHLPGHHSQGRVPTPMRMPGPGPAFFAPPIQIQAMTPAQFRLQLPSQPPTFYQPFHTPHPVHHASAAPSHSLAATTPSAGPTAPSVASSSSDSICEFFNRKSGCLSLRSADFICGFKHVCSKCHSPEHGLSFCPHNPDSALHRAHGLTRTHNS